MHRKHEFIDAVKAGNIESVKKLLQEDSNLAAVKDENAVSAILLAKYYGNHEIVEVLRNAGIVLNVFEAAATGTLERVDEFIREHPERIDEYSGDGFTALGLAAFFGYAEIVELLLANGADVNVVSRNEMRVRPIHSAVANPNTDAVYAIAEILLKNGADVNVQQNGGWTPLHQAAAQGLNNLVTLLLSYNADPDAVSDDGKTPTDMATEKGHHVTNALLDRHVRKKNV